MQRRFVCIAAILLCAMNAFADGIYIYRAKPPAIPSQRAIIVYKGGIERLQVESVVQSEGTSLAWILPVPATPTDIHEASPGFLKTLALNVGPEFIGGYRFGVRYFFAVVAAVLIGAWALLVLLIAPGYKAAVPLTVIAAVIVTLAVIGSGLFSLTRGAGTPSRTVRVERASVVGSYDVSVLDAPDAAALDAWLAQNGFTGLPEAGKPIVADYIKKGWRFVTAKLRTESGQLLRPHPLELTFPTKQAVYPMRLTALANCDVYLELFVVADKTARADSLTTEIVDRVDRTIARQTEEDRHKPRARLKWAAIDHPATSSYLWEGCTITRLDGTLGPAQMDKDILFEFTDSIRTRKTYFTLEARSLTAWTCAFGIGTLVLITLTLASTFKENRKLRRKAIVVSAAVAVLAAVAAGGVCRIVLPAKDAVEVGGGHGGLANWHLQYGDYFMFTVLELADFNSGFEQLPPSEIASIVHAHLTYTPIFNNFTGERLLYEDSPGNLLLESDSNRVVVKTFSQIGSMYTHDVKQFLEEFRKYDRSASTHPEELDAKGLEKAFKDWREWPGSVNKPTHIEAMYAIAHDPQRLAGPSFKIIEEYCEGQKIPALVLEIAVGGLGLATKTVPPPDLTDREALKAFLVQVKSRLQTQAAAPNPGG